MKIFKQYSAQAIKTFIGTALVKLATGVIGIWGTINLYFLSYLKNSGNEVTSKTNSLLLMCVILPTCFFVLLATKFSSYLGYKTVVRTCSVIFTVAPLFFNIALNLYTLAFFFLLVPMSCFALSSIPILNCLWSQFPKDLNKVSGSAILFFSLGMITWNIIFFQIVNPENKPAVIDQFNQAFFTKEISDRVVTATNWIFLLAGSCFIVGSLLIQKREAAEAVQGKQILQIQEFGVLSAIKQKKQDKNVENQFFPKSEAKPKLLQTLKDKKFIILFMIAFLVPLYLVYLVMFMKIIFMPILNDDRFLAVCSIILTLSAVFGAPFWGLVADRLGFKKTLFLVCLADIFVKVFGLFCNQKWSIATMYFSIGFTDKGVMTIIGPGLIEIFGLQMATELIPYKGLSTVLAFLSTPLIQMLFGSILTYKQILIIFIVFTLLSVGLSYYFWQTVHYIPFSESQQQEKQLIGKQSKLSNKIESNEKIVKQERQSSLKDAQNQ